MEEEQPIINESIKKYVDYLEIISTNTRNEVVRSVGIRISMKKFREYGFILGKKYKVTIEELEY